LCQADCNRGKAAGSVQLLTRADNWEVGKADDSANCLPWKIRYQLHRRTTGARAVTAAAIEETMAASPEAAEAAADRMFTHTC